MSKIKDIFDEIAAESSTLKKVAILTKYKDNALLERVLYLAKSKRVKFYIKQIPPYESNPLGLNFQESIEQLVENLTSRKISGNEAIHYLGNVLANVEPDEAYVIERIIEKDLKIGMGTTQINKVFPNLIEKTPYQGAKSYAKALAIKLFSGKPIPNHSSVVAYSDIKMDGRYANAIIDNGTVELESRQGETTYIGNSPLLKELARFGDCVLNGELTIDGVPNRAVANGMVTSIIDIEKKRVERTPEETQKHIHNFEDRHGSYDEAIENIRYTVWDIITLDEYFERKSTKPYYLRRKILKGWLDLLETTKVVMVESREVRTLREAMEHFLDALARGLEGTILKSATDGWKDGKPTYQVKMKLEMSVDLKIVGFKYGSEGTKNENVISTLVTESSCGLLKSEPSGMTEAMMEYVTENQDALLGTIVEVRSCGLTQGSKGAVNGEYALLHPSVVELRDDKDTCDSLASAMEIEEMAKSLSVA